MHKRCTQGLTQRTLHLVCHAVLVAGYYAAAMSSGAVTEARPCPQKYFCPGGQPLQQASLPAVNALDTTLQLCPNGLWTQAPGATKALDCCKLPGCSEPLLHVAAAVGRHLHWAQPGTVHALSAPVTEALHQACPSRSRSLAAAAACSDPSWVLHSCWGDHQVRGRQLQGWLGYCIHCNSLHVLRHWCVRCRGCSSPVVQPDLLRGRLRQLKHWGDNPVKLML